MRIGDWNFPILFIGIVLLALLASINYATNGGLTEFGHYGINSPTYQVMGDDNKVHTTDVMPSENEYTLDNGIYYKRTPTKVSDEKPIVVQPITAVSSLTYPAFQGSGKVSRDSYAAASRLLPSFTLKLDSNDYGRVPTQQWLEGVNRVAHDKTYNLSGDYGTRKNQEINSELDQNGVGYWRIKDGNNWERVIKYTDYDGIEKYIHLDPTQVNIDFTDGVEIDKLSTFDPSYSAPSSQTSPIVQEKSSTVGATTPSESSTTNRFDTNSESSSESSTSESSSPSTTRFG